MTPQTQFSADDHRNYNRYGESFDVGETFSGVPYEIGLQAVEELKAALPPGYNMIEAALRWITMFDAVTCAIPGMKRPDQARQNIAAGELAPLPAPFMDKVVEVYDRYIRQHVHHRW